MMTIIRFRVRGRVEKIIGFIVHAAAEEKLDPVVDRRRPCTSRSQTNCPRKAVADAQDRIRDNPRRDPQRLRETLLRTFRNLRPRRGSRGASRKSRARRIVRQRRAAVEFDFSGCAPNVLQDSNLSPAVAKCITNPLCEIRRNPRVAGDRFENLLEALKRRALAANYISNRVGIKKFHAEYVLQYHFPTLAWCLARIGSASVLIRMSNWNLRFGRVRSNNLRDSRLRRLFRRIDRSALRIFWHPVPARYTDPKHFALPKTINLDMRKLPV
jgi:hypothetical protein